MEKKEVKRGKVEREGVDGRNEVKKKKEGKVVKVGNLEEMGTYQKHFKLKPLSS